LLRKGYDIATSRPRLRQAAFLAGSLVLALLTPFAAHAQYRSSISFHNGAGEEALVKLIVTGRNLPFLSGSFPSH